MERSKAVRRLPQRRSGRQDVVDQQDLESGQGLPGPAPANAKTSTATLMASAAASGRTPPVCKQLDHRDLELSGHDLGKLMGVIDAAVPDSPSRPGNRRDEGRRGIQGTLASNGRGEVPAESLRDFDTAPVLQVEDCPPQGPRELPHSHHGPCNARTASACHARRRSLAPADRTSAAAAPGISTDRPARRPPSRHHRRRPLGAEPVPLEGGPGRDRGSEQRRSDERRKGAAIAGVRPARGPRRRFSRSGHCVRHVGAGSPAGRSRRQTASESGSGSGRATGAIRSRDEGRRPESTDAGGARRRPTTMQTRDRAAGDRTRLHHSQSWG